MTGDRDSEDRNWKELVFERPATKGPPPPHRPTDWRF